MVSARKRDEGIYREVVLAAVDSRGDDTKELAVEVGLDGNAFVRGEDADLVDLACLHQDGGIVRIAVGNMADVAIARRVLVLGIPDRAAAVEVVGEKDLRFAVKRHAPVSAPAPLKCPVNDAFSGLGVQCTPVSGAVPAMRRSLDCKGLVDRQEADVAFLHEYRFDDFAIGGVDFGNRVRVALDVGHHQAAKPGELGKCDCLR